MTLILSYRAVKQKDATQKNIKECVASNQKLLGMYRSFFEKERVSVAIFFLR